MLRALPPVVVGVAALAAWTAARAAWGMPLVWLALLLACLAIAPSQRRLLAPPWAAAVLLALALGWVVALDHELALRHTLLVPAALLLGGLARRRPPSRAALAVLGLALAATAAVALAQVGGGLEEAAAGVERLEPALREAAEIRLRGGRAFGTSTLPGHYAALLLLALPLIIERGASTRGLTRAGWVAVAVAVVAVISLTRSGAALLVAAAMLVLALVAVGKRPALLAAAAVLAVLAAALLAGRADLLHLEPVHLRWINWQTTAWAFAAHPWLGVGLGGVGQAGLLAPLAAVNITPYAHNTPLQLVAELGLAGAGLVAMALLALIRLIGAGLRVEPGLAIAVAVLPLHNLIDFSAYAPEVLLPWAVLVGALAGRLLPLPARPLPAAPLILVLGGGLALATLAWRAEEQRAVAAAEQEARVDAVLAATAWAPWEITPLLAAAEQAIGRAQTGGADTGELRRLDDAILARHWVRPRSSSWAEARARLLLALGRPGEAAVMAQEARRRAPWRGDLAALEAACAARP